MDAMSSEGLVFADLISPLPLDEFHEKVRGREPKFIPGDPEKFASAMSWDILTDLLNQTAIWTPHTLELVLDNVKIPPDRYCRMGQQRDGSQGLLADMDQVKEWLKKGASMVLNDIETLTPGMKRIADMLGKDPGGLVQGNLYCSWEAHQAFAVHFDTHDVFALQIAGEKDWLIYQRHFKDPINHPEFATFDQEFHDTHKGEVSMKFTMTPGDMVYIPRGFYHEALASSPGTVHLSYSLVPMIGLDLISAVFERAVHDEVFRQNVPHISIRDGKAAEEHWVRLAGRFRELVRDPEFMEKMKLGLERHNYPRSYIRLPDDAGS